MLWSMIDMRKRALPLLFSLLLAEAAPCLAASEFPGFGRSERLRLTQDAPIVEYMILDDFPMRLLVPSWGEISAAMKDSDQAADSCTWTGRATPSVCRSSLKTRRLINRN